MKDCCERNEDTSNVTVGTGGQRQLVDRFRGKFVREAQMIHAMYHTNIVRVTDVFEENGTAYYVMDYLPGGSLADKVKKEGPLSEAKAELFIRQVADALDYIHSQHTVHLDVKPSNILLSAKGDAVLIDFGISKHYDDAGEQTSSTPVGISKGYAPLEQNRDGDVSQFKPSTDIYALGATLYYLVSGIVPPEASIVNEDGLERPIGISDRIWKAIESAMQPRRKDRPQNVKTFLSLLDKKTAEDSEETVLIAPTKPKEFNMPVLKTEPNHVKKKSKTWLWPLLAGAAIAAVLIGLLLGGNSESAVSIADGNINGHGWVDLGLSVKWATCNVGASSPSDYGGYYAWGEITIKDEYKWTNYRFRTNGNTDKNVTLFKYNNSNQRGVVDNKIWLEQSDDMAHVNWGGNWRIPSDSEWTELRTKCKWTWTSQDGKNGYKVTGLNGNSIFLPAAGMIDGTTLHNAVPSGNYWSCSLNTDNPLRALSVYFDSGGVFRYDTYRRYGGLSIRPILE